MRDVAYFFTSAVSPRTLQQHEGELLRHYHAQLAARLPPERAAEYTMDVATEHFELCLLVSRARGASMGLRACGVDKGIYVGGSIRTTGNTGRDGCRREGGAGGDMRPSSVWCKRLLFPSHLRRPPHAHPPRISCASWQAGGGGATLAGRLQRRARRWRGALAADARGAARQRASQQTFMHRQSSICPVVL